MSVFVNVHVFLVHNFAITICRFFDLSTNKIRDVKLLTNVDFKTFGFIIATAAFIITQKSPIPLLKKLVFETKKPR